MDRAGGGGEGWRWFDGLMGEEGRRGKGREREGESQRQAGESTLSVVDFCASEFTI